MQLLQLALVNSSIISGLQACCNTPISNLGCMSNGAQLTPFLLSVRPRRHCHIVQPKVLDKDSLHDQTTLRGATRSTLHLKVGSHTSKYLSRVQQQSVVNRRKAGELFKALPSHACYFPSVEVAAFIYGQIPTSRIQAQRCKTNLVMPKPVTVTKAIVPIELTLQLVLASICELLRLSGGHAKFGPMLKRLSKSEAIDQVRIHKRLINPLHNSVLSVICIRLTHHGLSSTWEIRGLMLPGSFCNVVEFVVAVPVLNT
eukprot:3499395-Amphidinium_carterae.1